MRSMSIRGVAGNAKLRGKKSHALSCGCCDLYDFRWEQRWKDAANEIEFEVRPVAGLEGDNDNDDEPLVETTKSLKPVRVSSTFRS